MNPILEDFKIAIANALETGEVDLVNDMYNKWNFLYQEKFKEDIKQFNSVIEYLETHICLGKFDYSDDFCNHHTDSQFNATISFLTSDLMLAAITFNLFIDGGRYSLKICRECKFPAFLMVYDKDVYQLEKTVHVHLDENGVRWEKIEEEE